MRRNIARQAACSARAIKRLGAACERRMTACDKFKLPRPERRFGGLDFRGSVASLQQGRPAVTFTLKWDVIAVCAVFVFVGAVLLGAF